MEKDVLELLERVAVALEKIAAGFDVQKDDGLSDCENSYSEECPGAGIFQGGECNPDRLLEALAQKGISVKSVPNMEAVESLDSIALFMGSRYDSIKRVYELIKKNLYVPPYRFSIGIKNWTQSEISYSCQLCNMLYQIAFLSEYKYEKSPRFVVRAAPNRIPEAISFLTGHWLEYYVKATMLEVVKEYPQVRYSYIVNPQVVLPNGNDFELDVVFMINDELFWVEAKTGEYQNYVQKYSEIAKIMGIKRERAFMVLSDLPQMSNVNILESMFSMSVVSVNDFRRVIEDKVRSLLGEEV